MALPFPGTSFVSPDPVTPWIPALPRLGQREKKSANTKLQLLDVACRHLTHLLYGLYRYAKFYTLDNRNRASLGGAVGLSRGIAGPDHRCLEEGKVR